MMGFGGMVRPDVTADVLGFVGFLTATGSTHAFVAGVVLSGAVLCKQSAVVYVAAAAASLIWMKQPKRAMLIVCSASVVTFAVLVAFWLSGERNVFRSVFLEGGSPWLWDQWRTIIVKLLVRAGDLVILCAAGLAGWCLTLRSHDAERADDSKRWLSLLAIGGGFALLGVAKIGSDLNYFLPLRYVAAVALAERIVRLRETSPGLQKLTASLVIFCALVLWTSPWVSQLQRHAVIDSDRGRMARIYQSEIDAIERSGRVQRVFTNCEDAGLRVGNPFLDVYAFNVMVADGRVNPNVLIGRLKNREYDLVVTTGSLDDPNYRSSPFALPFELTNAILAGYDKVSQSAVVYYRPKTRKRE
jgi:hypothetical protein